MQVLSKFLSVNYIIFFINDKFAAKQSKKLIAHHFMCEKQFNYRQPGVSKSSQSNSTSQPQYLDSCRYASTGSGSQDFRAYVMRAHRSLYSKPTHRKWRGSGAALFTNSILHRTNR